MSPVMAEPTRPSMSYVSAPRTQYPQTEFFRFLTHCYHCGRHHRWGCCTYSELCVPQFVVTRVLGLGALQRTQVMRTALLTATALVALSSLAIGQGESRC